MTDPGSHKSADAYRTISEVASDLKLPQHVLRFWETRFSQVKPLKRAGGRRFYRPEDVDLLRAVKTLLYGDGYTIKGVQRILREQGPKAVAALAASPARRGTPPSLPPVASEPWIDAAPAPPTPLPPTVRLDLAPAASAPRAVASDIQPDVESSRLPTARLRVVLAEIETCARLLSDVRNASC